MVKLPSGKYFNPKHVVSANWHQDGVSFVVVVLGEGEDRYFSNADGLFLERVLNGLIDYYLQSMGEDD